MIDTGDDDEFAVPSTGMLSTRKYVILLKLS